jgi:4-hydroxy-2-oxoheptanedioate aldolase
MRNSQVLAKLRSGQPALITCLHLADPALFEMTSLLGFDGIWLDLEHHHHSVETSATFMRAARVGCSDVMVRPGKGEFMRLGRILEAGANGIMYPRCDDAAEAAEVVRWAKFAPLGQRGFDGAGADSPYGEIPMPEYIRTANEQTFLVVQLEDQKAVDDAERIAAVPGVDALMFGPADFTVLSGIPGQWDHPRVQAAVERVAAAAKNQGKHWGTPAFNLEHCRQLMAMGARIHFHMADIVLVRDGLKDIQRRFGQLGFTFENRLVRS